MDVYPLRNGKPGACDVKECEALRRGLPLPCITADIDRMQCDYRMIRQREGYTDHDRS